MAHILDGDGLRTRAGWCCPGCSRCYGPQVDECRHCPDGETGKDPEPVIYTDKGPVPFSAFARAGSAPATGPETVSAIFVPLRDTGLTVTPSQILSVEAALNRAAQSTGNLVDGKFAVLPVGAKILPAHPGCEWVRVIPPMIPDPGSTRIMRATGEWADVVPGFQCRVPFCAGEYQLEFRLTPADGSP